MIKGKEKGMRVGLGRAFELPFHYYVSSKLLFFVSSRRSQILYSGGDSTTTKDGATVFEVSPSLLPQPPHPFFNSVISLAQCMSSLISTIKVSAATMIVSRCPKAGREQLHPQHQPLPSASRPWQRSHHQKSQ